MSTFKRFLSLTCTKLNLRSTRSNLTEPELSVDQPERPAVCGLTCFGHLIYSIFKGIYIYIAL
jgi:hypothetical protein